MWAQRASFHAQVEVREGWPRWKSQTQRLPFDEEQWRRKPLRNLIGLSKPQNMRRVIRFVENVTQGALELLPRFCICIAHLPYNFAVSLLSMASAWSGPGAHVHIRVWACWLLTALHAQG